MRNWILGGMLACVSSAGVAYVLAKNSTGSHCGPCIEKPVVLETVQKDPITGRCDAYPIEGSASSCEHCNKTKVVDVVDLDRSFRMADGTPKPVVSFEEPPLAKPRGEVMPVRFEEPAAVEVLPMPREVK
jgi:hypothetical protein